MSRRGPRTTAGKAIAKEQAALAKLPHREIDVEEREDYYSNPPVFALCHYSGKEPKREEHGFAPRIRVTFSCQYCGLVVEDDAPLPKHSRMIDIRDQLREVVDTVCEVLGIDPWSDAGNRASWAPQSENRGTGLDGKLGEALNILAGALFRRDATTGMAKAITALDTVVLDSDGDVPLMSEHVLYERLGKEDARTVLALWGNVTRAAGR